MKNLIFVAALLFAANNLFAQTDLSQLKNAGNEALGAKNYELAFTNYDSYLKQTNNADSVIAFNCGVCADKTKRYEEAVKYFDIAIQKNFNLANAYIGKAGALKDLKRNKEYVATLETALKAVPDNKSIEKLYANFFLKRGQIRQKNNKLNEAEEAYKKVVDLRSKAWKLKGYYSLGVLFFNNGINILSAATPLASSNAEKYSVAKEKAVTSYKKAESYLKSALEVAPKNANVQKLLKQVQDSMK